MNKKIKALGFGVYLTFLMISSCAKGPVSEAPTANQTDMAGFLSAVAPEDTVPPSAFTETMRPEFSPTPTVTLTPTPTPTPTSTPVPEVTSTRLATGRSHTCALTPQGGVQCWGDNKYGQLGNKTMAMSSKPVNVKGLESGVLAVAAATDNTCALRDDGGVTCWGMNGFPPAAVDGFRSRVTAIAVGLVHACGLLDSGGVQCWGENNQGQLGNGTFKASETPVDVDGLDSGVLSITAGGYHSCALLTGGGVKCWGLNSDGELGDGTTKRSAVPVDVAGLSGRATAIKAGSSHNCVILSSDGLQCWGNNFFGQLGNKTNMDSNRPVKVNGLSKDVLAITAGDGHTCALLITGWMKCWGGNGMGQLGYGITGDNEKFFEPVDVRWRLNGITDLAAGGNHTCVRLSNGGLKCWGSNDDGQLGDGTTKNSTEPVDVIGLSETLATYTPIPQYKAVALARTCILTDLGGVLCWGSNASGVLGDGTDLDSSIPVYVEGLTSGASAIASAYGISCAITTTGGLKCWGFNGYGQLGNGTTINSNRPVDVNGLDKDVVAVGIGPMTACAAMRTGGVKCWGKNDYGQMGIGNSDTITHTTPVDVVGLTDSIKELALDFSVSCAITTAGSVKCWGSSAVGQLGNGEGPLRKDLNASLPDLTLSYTPTDVTGWASGIKDIALTKGTAYALTEDGKVIGWGDNCCGQVGDGTQTDRNIPVLVNLIPPSWTINAISSPYPLALVDNKYLISWDLHGIHIAKDFSSLPAGIVGFSSNCVLTGTGGVKCWGDNTYGGLGNGTYSDSTTPVDVIGFPG